MRPCSRSARAPASARVPVPPVTFQKSQRCLECFGEYDGRLKAENEGW